MAESFEAENAEWFLNQRACERMILTFLGLMNGQTSST
jgi:hypothetical protein